ETQHAMSTKAYPEGVSHHSPRTAPPTAAERPPRTRSDVSHHVASIDARSTMAPISTPIDVPMAATPTATNQIEMAPKRPVRAKLVHPAELGHPNEAGRGKAAIRPVAPPTAPTKTRKPRRWLTIPVSVVAGSVSRPWASRDNLEAVAAIWKRLDILLETHAEAEERYFDPHVLEVGTAPRIPRAPTTRSRTRSRTTRRSATRS